MSIVVTGAAGFIGSRLSGALLNAGESVVGIDRLGEGEVPDVRLWRAWQQLQARPGFTGVAGDLADLPLPEVLAGASAVVHLAGRPGTQPSWDIFPAYLRDNVEVSAELAKACLDAGVPKFVHGSSSSVYGRFALGAESAPLDPISPYGASKLAAEATLRSFFHSFGLPLVVLRFFSVYGPGQRPDMGVHKAIEAALTGRPFHLHGDGLQSRSLTFVDDVVNAILAAVRSGVPGSVYNVGGTTTYSMVDVLDEIAGLLGTPAPVVPVADPPGNQYQTSADGAKAALELGFLATVGLREGLSRQIDWHRSIRETVAAQQSTLRAVAG